MDNLTVTNFEKVEYYELTVEGNSPVLSPGHYKRRVDGNDWYQESPGYKGECSNEAKTRLNELFELRNAQTPESIGRHLIDSLKKLQSDDDSPADITYGWTFYFRGASRREKPKPGICIDFDIEYGHYIPDNEIILFDDGSFSISLQEPFEGGGETEEIEELINYMRNEQKQA